MSFGELYFLICQCLFSPVYYVTCSLYVHPSALSMPVFFDGSVFVSSLWEMYFWCSSFLYLSHVYFLDLICEFWRAVIFICQCFCVCVRSVSSTVVSMPIPRPCQCLYSLMGLYLYPVSPSMCMWVCSHSYLSSACLALFSDSSGFDALGGRCDTSGGVLCDSELEVEDIDGHEGSSHDSTWCFFVILALCIRVVYRVI